LKPVFAHARPPWLVLLAVAACGREHGPPRVQRNPTPDRGTPVRNGGPARSERIASYKIDARLDTDRHQISGNEVLTWTNSGQSPVDKLPIHLYMNAFKNDATLFMRTSLGQIRGAAAADNAWGWIQLDSVQIAGVELSSKLVYPGAPGDLPDHRDQTVAVIPLAEPLAPGDKIDVAFKFTEQLPEVFARTGYKGDFHMVGQWFPKIGVRTGPSGAEQWQCQPFGAWGEFFADFGTYDVTLTVPSTLVVAATGVLVKAAESPGTTRTLTYRAEDVHDFAWMADPYMRVTAGQAKVEDGTVEVRVYARPEQAEFAKRHLQAAIGAIERFSADFVPYPWQVMTVVDPPVDAAAGAGGMEYPTLVTTGGDSVFARPGIRVPEYVTIHEIGHNWFQGLLANNEPEEAWLDEGVDQWADGHVMAELYGARHSGIDWLGWEADFAPLTRSWGAWEDPPFIARLPDPGELPSPIATPTYAFPDEATWVQQTYITTERALTTLEQIIGPSKMMAAMRAYTKTWKFRHPTGRDLFDALAREVGESLEWFVAPVFLHVGGLHLAVRDKGCRPAHAPRGVFDGTAPPFGGAAGRAQVPAVDNNKNTVTETEAPDTGGWHCAIEIASTGTVHVPVDVELKFADGSSERRLWDDRDGAPWTRFVLEHSAPLVEVRLDPDGKLALDSPLHHDLRLDSNGDGAASLRAGARVAAWAQTLMQLVGP
jgi:hypothetical protein